MSLLNVSLLTHPWHTYTYIFAKRDTCRMCLFWHILDTPIHTYMWKEIHAECVSFMKRDTCRMCLFWHILDTPIHTYMRKETHAECVSFDTVAFSFDTPTRISSDCVSFDAMCLFQVSHGVSFDTPKCVSFDTPTNVCLLTHLRASQWHKHTCWMCRQPAATSNFCMSLLRDTRTHVKKKTMYTHIYICMYKYVYIYNLVFFHGFLYLYFFWKLIYRFPKDAGIILVLQLNGTSRHSAHDGVSTVCGRTWYSACHCK